jgi:hypothetical protein
MDPRIQIRIRIHPQNVMDPHHCSVSGWKLAELWMRSGRVVDEI